jgi:predicted acetyltransferase
MVVRGIKPGEIDACLDVLDKSFENTTRDYFKRYFYGDPWFKPEYTVVCEDDGKLTSIVQICRREVRYGDSTLTLGGIANVGTPPEFRGRGYSSETLKGAVEVMTMDGIDFSTLYTGINAFYERVGYTTIEFRYGAGTLLESLRPLDDPSYTVRDYRDDDAETVVDIYNEFNKDVVMSAVRTPEYWRDFAVNPVNSRQEIWVAENEGQVVGYISGLPYGKSYSISEMCCRAGHEAALHTLAYRIWERTNELRLDEIIHRLPDKGSVISAVNSISTPNELREATYLMCRVLNLQSMIGKMLPELTRRSENLTYEGAVTLAVECAGQVTLEMSPGRVELIEKPVEPKLNLTQWQFINLIFGYKNPHDILPSGEISDLLARLFPENTPVYYNIDGF